ncbi:transcription elongation factor A N-terminal and central domain-containing protein 2-like [Lepeophtheirus salmonis]|uniref:transcription elongation factor A N-terminal and central domain-containing protein 2-like n=1 Tax=Lepeophtheirus salmonis TaxID=72036 RepID=UPI003AF35259
MDKFVIRSPRPTPSFQSKFKETAAACLTQSRIEDLAGVVNLKEFEELRRRLESRQGDHHREVIHTLRKKNPSSKIIRKSGILEALRRRKDIPEGLELYNEWKRLLEKRKDSSTRDQVMPQSPNAPFSPLHY